MCKFIVSGFVFVFLLNLSDAIKERCIKQGELPDRCNMGLPVLSSTEISFALTRDELDKSCIELSSGIRCIDNYTNVCMEKHEQVVFRKIYAGIKDVVRELCQRGDYQEDYLKHAKCVKNVRPEYEKCSKAYEGTLTQIADHPKTEYQTELDDGSSQEHNLRTVCCSFQEYLRCSVKTVQAECGDEAALFTSKFLKRMAFNIIKNYCLSYQDTECGFPDSAAGVDHSVIMISVAVFANVVAYMSNALVPT